MPVPNLVGAESSAPARTAHPGLKESAEDCLRRNPYPALKNVSCDCRGGVLVLRGCVPTYYLKQVAQEAVAPLEGVERIDNQIQVARAAVPEPPPDNGRAGVPDAGGGPGEGRRELSADSGRRTETAVRVLAPFGEAIEVDG
jgi:hypothetical protein